MVCVLPVDEKHGPHYYLDRSLGGTYLQYLATKSDIAVIQQYTGVKDKNGKKIFEGDIVKTDPNHVSNLLKDKTLAPDYTNGEVKWLREAFCVCQKGVGGTNMSEYVLLFMLFLWIRNNWKYIWSTLCRAKSGSCVNVLNVNQN